MSLKRKIQKKIKLFKASETDLVSYITKLQNSTGKARPTSFHTVQELLDNSPKKIKSERNIRKYWKNYKKTLKFIIDLNQEIDELEYELRYMYELND
jgi:hypothetical protein